MIKSCAIIFEDGKIEFSKYNSDYFPKLSNRIDKYGERIEYKDNELSKLLKEQFNDNSDTFIEISPMNYYDKYGYNLNMIFVTGKEIDEETHKKLFKNQNIYGIFYVKHRCPYGYCIIYDENIDINDKIIEDIKIKGKLKINNIECPKNGSRKNQLIKYINELYKSKYIHHEVLIILLENDLKKNYVINKRPVYYDFFNSYSIKYGELFPVEILMGDKNKMAESYNKNVLKFPQKK